MYHNPRCSKCRLTLELLQAHGKQPEIVEYLTTPPSHAELVEILAMLKLSPRQLMRTHEAEYKDNSLADESLSDEALIDAMVRMPKLIERPIVINNGKAAIGRPPKNIEAIL